MPQDASQSTLWNMFQSLFRIPYRIPSYGLLKRHSDTTVPLQHFTVTEIKHALGCVLEHYQNMFQSLFRIPYRIPFRTLKGYHVNSCHGYLESLGYLIEHSRLVMSIAAMDPLRVFESQTMFYFLNIQNFFYMLHTQNRTNVFFFEQIEFFRYVTHAKANKCFLF